MDKEALKNAVEIRKADFHEILQMISDDLNKGQRQKLLKNEKIKEAFEVFDHESNNTVDVREVRTIIRSLGCCPSEGELHDLIAEVSRLRNFHTWLIEME